MTVLLPASFEEAAPMQCAREMLRVARGAFEDGDPFDAAVASAAVRQMLKAIAASGERNAAHIVRLANVGSEDADEALRDLISERNARREPLGMALGTYVNMVGGEPPHTEPRGAPGSNFLANFVIVMMLLGLKHQFPLLRLCRALTAKPGKVRRPSACSIVSAVLIEAGLNRGGEEAIRKIWEHYGPPAIPARLGPPKNGTLRFISDDFPERCG
jgi:hypothetical protein